MGNGRRRHCQHCEEIFQVSREWQLFCSNACRQRWNYLENGHCFYCGEPGNIERDHIYPVSARTNFKENRSYAQETVPACKECNQSLNSRIFDDVKDRIKWLSDYYTSKYKLKYGVIEWSDEETIELGHNLRSHIRHSISKRQKAERRVIYMKVVIRELNSRGISKMEEAKIALEQFKEL